MKTFEEQFPSLNKAIVDNNETFPDIEFMLKVIEVHCLDKQRVREVIEKHTSTITLKGIKAIILTNKFLSELGL